MANKSNKKPGQNSVKNSALAMKKSSSNLNQSKTTKIIMILMILAFVGPVIAGLVILFF